METSYYSSPHPENTSLSSDGVSWDKIITKGSSESISSMPYTSTRLPVDLARNMTSEQTKPTSAERGATQTSKGKEKEKPLATSSKKGAIDAEDPHVIVGSGKSNLLFS
jgi:hypothetical protein